ncbi:Golgi SNAP receptor complex member 1 [[Candida] zeylanoides]
MSSFAQTRAQALHLEKQTDALLSKFSGFQHTSATSASEEEAAVDAAINDILEKRQAVVAALAKIAESDLTLSTSKLQQLQRHREILGEHRGVYHRIREAIKDDRNRNNLLFSVRSDIDAHKQRTVASSAAAASAQDAHGYINDERVRADNANSFAERLLQQAYNTRDELFTQRNYLQNAQSTMMSTIQTVPGLNILISKINTRRKRDTVIVATVIAVCIILLVFY